ncbi:MAG TPA: hypothetical protein VG518_03460, partial [Solirubrobacterales bacterium]|nr:hypothetical protein [Solirubrobacterales bacterium]
IAELLSSGAGVLAVCSDASRRAALATGAAGLARFNGGTGQVACGRCGGGVVEGLAKRAASGLALTDYAALECAPALAAEFSHVVLVDPPASAREARLAANGFGYLHPVWTEAERAFALSVLGERYPQRGAIKAQFEALREAGKAEGVALRRALEGSGAQPLSPEVAARCLRVLTELKLVRGKPNGGTGSVGVVSSKGTDLERSNAFRAYGARYEEGQRYLERPQQP